jgi:pimeloyl-ACP methyl ester carboxylesterase
MSATRYDPENINPFWFEDPERHETAMREAVETLTLTADDGQQFSALHLNRDFSEQPAIVSFDAMFTGCNSPEQKYAAYQYAAANPDRAVLKIDMPAHGYSDALTDRQYKEITGAHTLGLIARSQAEALRRRLPDAEGIIAAGDSLGARGALDFAQQAAGLGFQTLKMIGFDTVGLEERPTPAVSFSYFLREWRRSRQLYYNDANQHLSDAYEGKFKEQLAEYGFENDFSMVEIFKRDPRILGFVFVNSPLAANTGAESLEEALESQAELTADLVVGGLSSICRWRKIKPLAEHLEETFPGRVSFDIWPNDSHGMGLAPQQPRMAAFVKDTLDDPSIH